MRKTDALRIVTLAGAIFSYVAATALAAPVPNQVRFAISPNASDPIWKTPNVKFEKSAECKVISAKAIKPAFPTPSEVLSTWTAKGPLFNPGTPKPDGTYASTPDDGFNTLFVPIEFPADPNSYIGCRGIILANGQPVTTATRSGLVAATLIQIGGGGPLTVSPSLNKTGLQQLVDQMPQKGLFTLQFNRALTSKASTANGPTSYYDLDSKSSSPAMTSQTDFYALEKSNAGNFLAQYVPIGLPNGATGSTAFPQGDFTGGPGYESLLQTCKSYTYVNSALLLTPSKNPSTMRFRCFKTSNGRFAAIRYSSFTEKPSSTGPAGVVYAISYTMTFEYVYWP
jgi:hypothetical protein